MEKTDKKFSVFPPPLMEKNKQSKRDTRSARLAHWKNYTRKTKAKQWEHENLLHNWFLPSSSHVIWFRRAAGGRLVGRMVWFGLAGWVWKEGRLCSVYSLEHRIDLLIHLFRFFLSYSFLLMSSCCHRYRLWYMMHSLAHCHLCLRSLPN